MGTFTTRVFLLLMLPVLLPAQSFMDTVANIACVPLFFLDNCQSTEEDSLGTVYIDFYRTYEELSNPGLFSRRKKYAISRQRIEYQVAQLNLWFGGRVRFRIGDVFDYDFPGMYRVTGDVHPCNLLRVNSTSGYFNPKRISAVYSESYGDDHEFFGCARAVFNTLGQVGQAPFVSMSNTEVRPISFLPIEVDGNTLAMTLAHEVGHIVGFDHTVARLAFSHVNRFRHCGLDLSYPAFRLDEDSFVDFWTREKYDINDWGGRTNVMGGLTADMIRQPFDWGFLGHYKYGDVFDQILQCWFDMSVVSE